MRIVFYNHWKQYFSTSLPGTLEINIFPRIYLVKQREFYILLKVLGFSLGISIRKRVK